MAWNNNNTQHLHFALQFIQNFMYMVSLNPHKTEMNFLYLTDRKHETQEESNVLSQNMQLESSGC